MTELVRWKHITVKNVTTSKLVHDTSQISKQKHLSAGSSADKCRSMGLRMAQVEPPLLQATASLPTHVACAW